MDGWMGKWIDRWGGANWFKDSLEQLKMQNGQLGRSPFGG